MSGSRKDTISQSVFVYPDSAYIPGMFEAEGFRLKALIATLSVMVALLVVLNIGPWSPWTAPASSALAVSTSVNTGSAMCTGLDSYSDC